MNFKYKNAVVLSKYILRDKIKKGDIVVDATCGNGYDSLFLSGLVGEEGRVYCFDIQNTAIKNTRKRLEEKSPFHNYVLIHDGHENVDKYIKTKINGAIFNLGYLPGGDHEVITTAQSTISSLEKILDMLIDGGMVVIIVYYGHRGGNDEKDALIEYLKGIDSKNYTIIKGEFINQINCPPLLVVIEKSMDIICEDK